MDRKPAFVSVASENDIWVALELPNQQNRDTIARVLNGKVTQYELPPTHGPRHVSIVAFSGSGRSVWFNNLSLARLGKLDLGSGHIFEYSTGGIVTSLNVDAAARVWTAEFGNRIEVYASNGRRIRRYDFLRKPNAPPITGIIPVAGRIWFTGVNYSVLGYVQLSTNNVHLCSDPLARPKASGYVATALTRERVGVARVDQDGRVIMASDDCKTILERSGGSSFVNSAVYDGGRHIMWLLEKMAAIEAVPLQP